MSCKTCCLLLMSCTTCSWSLASKSRKFLCKAGHWYHFMDFEIVEPLH
jgi:hypothetical protein